FLVSPAWSDERVSDLPSARPDAIAGRIAPAAGFRAIVNRIALRRADRGDRRSGSWLHRGGHNGSPSGGRHPPLDFGRVKYLRVLPTGEFTMIGGRLLTALKAMIIRDPWR